jgi:DNA repair exonuclease SbcCD nuclease subunit
MCGLLGERSGLNAHRALWSAQIKPLREQGATHVIVLGDLFDDPFPSQEAQLVAMQALASMDDMRVLVYIGNHDVHDASHNSLRLLSQMPGFGALRHVQFVFTPQVVEWDGLRIGVVPWGYKPPQMHDVDFIVFHHDMIGTRQDSGRITPQGEGLRADVFGDVLAIGGHLHEPQRLGRCVFVGAGAQLNFGEKPGKRAVTLRYEQGKMKLRSTPIESPWYLKTVKYDAKEPPRCDEARTYYRLDQGGDTLPAGWLVQHPRIVRVESVARKRSAENTVKLVEGKQLSIEDDTTLVRKFLREHTDLDPIMRARAMKIHLTLPAHQGVQP